MHFAKLIILISLTRCIAQNRLIEPDIYLHISCLGDNFQAIKQQEGKFCVTKKTLPERIHFPRPHR